MSEKICDKCGGTGRLYPGKELAKKCSKCGDSHVVDYCQGYKNNECVTKFAKGFCYPCIKYKQALKDGLCDKCYGRSTLDSSW